MPSWSAQPNDIIGGWIVTEHGKPASAHRSASGERESWPIECVSQEWAKAVAHLLNADTSPEPVVPPYEPDSTLIEYVENGGISGFEE